MRGSTIDELDRPANTNTVQSGLSVGPYNDHSIILSDQMCVRACVRVHVRVHAFLCVCACKIEIVIQQGQAVKPYAPCAVITTWHLIALVAAVYAPNGCAPPMTNGPHGDPQMPFVPK